MQSPSDSHAWESRRGRSPAAATTDATIVRPFGFRQVAGKFDPDPPAFRAGSPRGLVRAASKSSEKVAETAKVPGKVRKPSETCGADAVDYAVLMRCVTVGLSGFSMLKPGAEFMLTI
jgi:hypothetical protein